MRTTFFSTKPYDRASFDAAIAAAGAFDVEPVYLEAHLNAVTASLAKGSTAISAFVNDDLGAETLQALKVNGVQLIALRCAGFNNVDLKEARRLGFTVTRVPAYSPHAVAEHAVALILALDRKVHRANARVHDGKFSLDGLMGFDLCGRTVGIVGAGEIGAVVAKIMLGFGCKVLVADPQPSLACRNLDVAFVDFAELLRTADIITLHCPLTPKTRHLVDSGAIEMMKSGVMLINTSRGAVVDAAALVSGLKSRKIGYVGLDVYEEEANVFFEDHSGEIIDDEVLARLLSFPNVVITSHQGFFTREAMSAIAARTLESVRQYGGESSERASGTEACVLVHPRQ